MKSTSTFFLLGMVGISMVILPLFPSLFLVPTATFGSNTSPDKTGTGISLPATMTFQDNNMNIKHYQKTGSSSGDLNTGTLTLTPTLESNIINVENIIVDSQVYGLNPTTLSFLCLGTSGFYTPQPYVNYYVGGMVWSEEHGHMISNSLQGDMVASSGIPYTTWRAYPNMRLRFFDHLFDDAGSEACEIDARWVLGMDVEDAQHYASGYPRLLTCGNPTMVYDATKSDQVIAFNFMPRGWNCQLEVGFQMNLPSQIKTKQSLTFIIPTPQIQVARISSTPIPAIQGIMHLWIDGNKMPSSINWNGIGGGIDLLASPEWATYLKSRMDGYTHDVKVVYESTLDVFTSNPLLFKRVRMELNERTFQVSYLTTGLQKLEGVIAIPFKSLLSASTSTSSWLTNLQSTLLSLTLDFGGTFNSLNSYFYFYSKTGRTNLQLSQGNFGYLNAYKSPQNAQSMIMATDNSFTNYVSEGYLRLYYYGTKDSNSQFNWNTLPTLTISAHLDYKVTGSFTSNYYYKETSPLYIDWIARGGTYTFYDNNPLSFALKLPQYWEIDELQKENTNLIDLKVPQSNIQVPTSSNDYTFSIDNIGNFQLYFHQKNPFYVNATKLSEEGLNEFRSPMTDPFVQIYSTSKNNFYDQGWLNNMPIYDAREDTVTEFNLALFPSANPTCVVNLIDNEGIRRNLEVTNGIFSGGKYRNKISSSLNGYFLDGNAMGLELEFKNQPSLPSYVGFYKQTEICTMEMVSGSAGSYSTDALNFYYTNNDLIGRVGGKVIFTLIENPKSYISTNEFYEFNEENVLPNLNLQNITMNGLNIPRGLFSSKIGKIGINNSGASPIDLNLTIFITSMTNEAMILGKSRYSLSVLPYSALTQSFSVNCLGLNIPLAYSAYSVFVQIETDLIPSSENYYFPLKLITTDKAIKFLNQTIYDCEESIRYNLQYEKIYPDASRLYIHYSDPDYINLPNYASDIFIVTTGMNDPNIEGLVSPTSSQLNGIAQPLRFMARITDLDNNMNSIQYQFAFKLDPSYKGGALDLDDNGYFETTWLGATSYGSNNYGFEWTQIQLSQQITNEYYQLMPTSSEYLFSFRVQDATFNTDQRTFMFSYNPIVDINVQEGNIDFNKYDPSGLWVLKTFANFSLSTDNVMANDYASGNISVHSSRLYQSLSLNLHMPEILQDAQNYQMVERYDYQGSFLNKTRIEQTSQIPLENVGVDSAWKLDSYMPVSLISFNIPSPDFSVVSSGSETINSSTQVYFNVEFSANHYFSNISARFRTDLLSNDYDWKIYYNFEGTYYLVENNFINFGISSEGINPIIGLLLSSINASETRQFRIVGIKANIETISYEPFWYSALIVIPGVMLWTIFTTRKKDSGEPNLKDSWGTLKYVGITIAIFGSAYAIAVIVWSFI